MKRRPLPLLLFCSPSVPSVFLPFFNPISPLIFSLLTFCCPSRSLARGEIAEVSWNILLGGFTVPPSSSRSGVRGEGGNKRPQKNPLKWKFSAREDWLRLDRISFFGRYPSQSLSRRTPSPSSLNARSPPFISRRSNGIRSIPVLPRRRGVAGPNFVTDFDSPFSLLQVSSTGASSSWRSTRSSRRAPLSGRWCGSRTCTCSSCSRPSTARSAAPSGPRATAPSSRSASRR